MTPEHRFKAEPNMIGRQRDGEVTVISDRCAGHGFVSRVDPGPWQSAWSELLIRTRHIVIPESVTEVEPTEVVELQ